MSGILDELMGQLGGGALGQISKTLGTNESQTAQATSLALPAILGALARNSSNGTGAQSLSNALAKDHDGSILDNLGSFLQNPEAGPGAGILKHALGGNRARVESNVSRGSGLDGAAVGKLMVTLAPIVMGMLGRQQRKQNMNANGLASLLSQESNHMDRRTASSGGAGLLGQLLDSDGDGDFDLADAAQKGMGLLGKMFGGR